MPSQIAARLYQLLRAAGVAVEEVSLGREDDKSTWRVRPEVLQSAAQPIIDAYTGPTPTTLLDEDANRRLNDKAMRSWARAVYEAIPEPSKSWVAVTADAKQKFKDLR